MVSPTATDNGTVKHPPQPYISQLHMAVVDRARRFPRWSHIPTPRNSNLHCSNHHMAGVDRARWFPHWSHIPTPTNSNLHCSNHHTAGVDRARWFPRWSHTPTPRNSNLHCSNHHMAGVDRARWFPRWSDIPTPRNSNLHCSREQERPKPLKKRRQPTAQGKEMSQYNTSRCPGHLPFFRPNSSQTQTQPSQPKLAQLGWQGTAIPPLVGVQRQSACLSSL